MWGKMAGSLGSVGMGPLSLATTSSLPLHSEWRWGCVGSLLPSQTWHQLSSPSRQESHVHLVVCHSLCH